MSIGIAVSTENAALDAALQRMAGLGQRPRPIWEAIGQYGESSTRLRFKKQTGPDGRRWVPSIRARETGGQTLVHKARLLRSVSHNASNQGVAWGTNLIYARMQNDGGVISARSAGALRFQMPGGGFVVVKKVTLPARPFVGVNDEDGREIEFIAVDVVYDAARNPKQGYSIGKGGK